MPGSRVLRAATVLFIGPSSMLFWTVSMRWHWTQKDQENPLKNCSYLICFPTKQVWNASNKDAVLGSKIISKYLTKFRPFRDVVICHILRHYSKEMKTKSNCECKLNTINEKTYWEQYPVVKLVAIYVWHTQCIRL